MNRSAKMDIIGQMLEDGHLFLHVNTSTPGVVLPANVSGKPNCILQVGYDMPVPIPDLLVTENEIFATLSFSGKGFHCNIPADAIFAVVNEAGKGMFFSELEANRKLIEFLSAEPKADVFVPQSTHAPKHPAGTRRAYSQPHERTHLRLVGN